MANAGKTAAQMRQEIVDSTMKVMDSLYGLMKPGEEMEFTTKQLAPLVDLTDGVTDDRLVELQRLDILTRTIKYGRHMPDGTWNIGRYAMWELHMSHAKAQDTVKAWGKKLMAGEIKSVAAERSGDRRAPAKPKTKAKAEVPAFVAERVHESVAVAVSETEDTRAIAGPEAPSPFAGLAPLRKADDATALVAAARQYANRGDQMGEHIKALQTTAKSLGIEIDESVLMAGIKLERDERLETVALILPVIDKLERDNARLISQMAERNQKSKEAEQLAIDNRRLRARVEALVSERVVAQQRAQA